MPVACLFHSHSAISSYESQTIATVTFCREEVRTMCLP